MKQNLSNQINLLEAKTHFSNLIQRVYSFYLKNWLSRLCSPFGTHVLLYTPFLSLQTPSSFSNKTSSINFSFTRNIKGREQITICKHNTPVAVLSPITKKPKIKTEDIVEQIMEFNKDKTLALYTKKNLETKVEDELKKLRIYYNNGYLFYGSRVGITALSSRDLFTGSS